MTERNDIYFFSSKLSYNILNSRTLHTNTGANGINITILRINRNFCSSSRLPCCTLNFNNVITNLRYFYLKKFFKQFTTGSGKNELKAWRIFKNLFENTLDSISRS